MSIEKQVEGISGNELAVELRQSANPSKFFSTDNSRDQTAMEGITNVTLAISLMVFEIGRYYCSSGRPVSVMMELLGDQQRKSLRLEYFIPTEESFVSLCRRVEEDFGPLTVKCCAQSDNLVIHIQPIGKVNERPKLI